ncbi:hypothetical protein HUG17_6744 [Dermatophagoides farinae]|uniref:Uncharacterized protein n=1 Tax=Dermatophagoides farinae TaxID=6954 RepID=A0A9D4P617_DERFA|nr:hypothetical protein HUG17_6744 [Dermatophagoides farinae]
MNFFIFIALIIFYLLTIYPVLLFYRNDELSLLVLIIFILIITNSLYRIEYMVGQLFVAMKYLLFIIEFFKLQLKRMVTNLQLTIKFGKFSQSHINMRMFWTRFLKEYVQLYYEMAILNQTISGIYFDIEAISKSAIICGSLFYSKQIQMNVYNTIIVIFFLSPFIYANGLYTRVAQFPLFNQIASRLTIQWLARLQYQKFYKHSIYRSRSLIHDAIKLNLFTQTMSDNRFGISCGQVFFITKFKFVELFLMNFVLILMFYKKFCLL